MPGCLKGRCSDMNLPGSGWLYRVRRGELSCSAYIITLVAILSASPVPRSARADEAPRHTLVLAWGGGWGLGAQLREWE